MDPLFDFTGKVVLVTGGSRGLGREMVLAFAERGADVVIASRKLQACEEVAREAEKKGRKALPIACHVGRWDEVGKLADAAYERFGRVDVLVNNAGMSPLYPALEDISEDLFDKVVGLNFKGPFRLSALVGSRMAKGDGGSIINISSTASLNPIADVGAVRRGESRTQLDHAVVRVRVRTEGAGQLHRRRPVSHRHIESVGHGIVPQTAGAASRDETRRRAERNRRCGVVPRESVGEFHDRHAGSCRRWDTVNKIRL